LRDFILYGAKKYIIYTTQPAYYNNIMCNNIIILCIIPHMYIYNNIMYLYTYGYTPTYIIMSWRLVFYVWFYAHILPLKIQARAISHPGGKFGKKLSGCSSSKRIPHDFGRGGGVVGGPNLKTMTRVHIISHLAPATKTLLLCVHFFPNFFFFSFILYFFTYDPKK